MRRLNVLDKNKTKEGAIPALVCFPGCTHHIDTGGERNSAKKAFVFAQSALTVLYSSPVDINFMRET